MAKPYFLITFSLVRFLLTLKTFYCHLGIVCATFNNFCRGNPASPTSRLTLKIFYYTPTIVCVPFNGFCRGNLSIPMSSKSEAFTTTQELLDDSRAAQDDVVDLEFQGSFATQIVGVQYYHGTITPHEMVLLHREPDNPYDANAVRVDNIHGIQVGHIPRVVMEHLAPWIDRKQVVLEATVHYVHGKYKIPVDIDVYCDPSIRESFSQALRRAGLTLSSASITAAAISPPPRSPPYHQPHYQRSPPSYRPPPPPPPPRPQVHSTHRPTSF